MSMGLLHPEYPRGRERSVVLDLAGTVDGAAAPESEPVTVPDWAGSVDLYLDCGETGAGVPAVVDFERRAPGARRFRGGLGTITKDPAGEGGAVFGARVTPGELIRARVSTKGSGGAVDTRATVTFLFSPHGAG